MALGVCERRAADEVRRRLDRLREAFNLQRQLGGERGQDSAWRAHPEQIAAPPARRAMYRRGRPEICLVTDTAAKLIGSGSTGLDC